MAETGFSLKYGGPALDTGRMPVSDIAPALLALGALFARSGELVHPEWPAVNLQIEANPERGSFLVHLLLEAPSVWNQISGMFTNDNVTALVNMKDLLVLPGIGVFELIRRRRHHSIVKQEPAARPGFVTITWTDGTVMTIPVEALTLLRDDEVQHQAARVVEPLRREGVEVVEFRTPSSQASLTITEDDVDAFDLVKLPDAEGLIELVEDRREMLLEVISIHFAGTAKWRFSDGSRVIPVRIDDEDFKARVAEGEPFSAGDTLRCRVRITQQHTKTGLSADYVVERVLAHTPRWKQLQLPDDDDGDDAPGGLMIPDI